MLAHLLKYDTAQGGYAGVFGENKHTVSSDDEANTITVDGKLLKIYKEPDANNCPWGELGVDVVLLVLRRLLSLLLQETISLQSFTTLTTQHSQLMTRSSLQLPAQQTALLL